MMRRFHHGFAVFVLFLLSQGGIVLAIEEGSHVTGTVVFRGTSPIVETMRVTADAAVCGNESLIQTVRVNQDTLGLRHAVVSVKGVPFPMTERSFSTRIIVKSKCAFVPRVEAARKGDILELQNRDSILHNTHIKVGKRTFLNVAQLARSRPIHKTLQQSGLHAIRCDKHKFMTGAFQVFDHSYFSVTDEFGGFQLPPLPAGTYTIVVWHETLGSLEQKVTVPSQRSVTVNFDYF